MTKLIRNIQFTKLIKADGKLKEFNFRKPNSSSEALFTVDVIDSKGNRIIFNMQYLSNAWKIISTGLPAWVIENEAVFNEIIEIELKQD